MSASPILITGGAQRVGHYCAQRLLDDGHPLIVGYRREHASLEALRRRGAITLQGDFAERAGILDFIARLRDETQALRAIVHNAASWAADTEDDGSGAHFERLFNVHMQAPYLINRHCRELLEACGEPQRDIVHITDHLAARGMREHAAYAATKAGLDNLTRSFAALYAPSIQVNAIAPGPVMLNGEDDGAIGEDARLHSAMGLVPGPGVIYQSLRYLLDNRFTTGVTLTVDGGSAGC